jgi:hypothetical protein
LRQRKPKAPAYQREAKFQHGAILLRLGFPLPGHFPLVMIRKEEI